MEMEMDKPQQVEDDIVEIPQNIFRIRLQECWERTNTGANRFRYLLLLLLFCFVIGALLLIAGAIAYVDSQNTSTAPPVFTFNDIFTMYPQSVDISWTSDGSGFSMLNTYHEIIVINLNTGSNTTLFSRNDAAMIGSFSSYDISPSQRYVLLGKDPTQRWQYSYAAHYVVFDTKTHISFPLGNSAIQRMSATNPLRTEDMFLSPLKKETYQEHKGPQREETVVPSRRDEKPCANLNQIEQNECRSARDASGSYQMNPHWTKRNGVESIAYIQNDNIWIQNVNEGVLSAPIAVTTNCTSTYLCGSQSWIYENEIFKDSNAMWWNTDGSMLAYLISDESQVGLFEFPVYSEQYPYLGKQSIRYPKAGTTNPTVRLFVYDLDTTQTEEVELVTEFAEYYVSGVWWVDRKTLAVRVIDRLQKSETLRFYSLLTKKSTFIWFQNSEKYTETNFDIRFISSAGTTCIVDIHADLASDQFRNILVYRTDGTRVDHDWVTAEGADVTNILGYNSNKHLLYYSVALNPTSRTISAIPFICKQTRSKEEMSRMTRNTPTRLTSGDGYYTASFSPNGAYYLLRYLGDGSYTSVPVYTIYSVWDEPHRAVTLDQLAQKHIREKGFQYGSEVVYRLNEKEKEIERSDTDSTGIGVTPLVLEDNRDFAAALSPKILGSRRYIRIPINNNTGFLNAVVTLPPGYPKKGKYQMILRIYGAPGSQTVDRRFVVGYDAYLTSSLQVVVASVDMRGSGFRGNVFEQQTYLALGELEASDVLATVAFFKSAKYRMRKVCVWGWGYGGYVAAKTLQRDTRGIVDCGVSVAPITDWKYFDTAYTERYMQKPQDKLTSYNGVSLLLNTTTFEKRSILDKTSIRISPNYLLIHGTADDLIHYQHSAEFSRQLVKRGVTFRSMAYTDADNMMTGQGTLQHMYAMMTNFFLENFEE